METLKDILKLRAKEAARTVEYQEVQESIDVICFRVGREVYAIEDRFVHEIYSHVAPTVVPCTPAFIIGIVNIRGNFVSLVDLEFFLGLGKIKTTDSGFIILLSHKDMEFGVMVEEIVSEIKIFKKNIQGIPQELNILKRELITGVTEDGTIIIDGKYFLEDSKIIVNEEI